MKFFKNRISIICVVLAFMLSLTVAGATDIQKEASARLPLENGRGVAAAFIGTSSDAVVIAGGSDFPDAFPWEGGKKFYSDNIWLIKKSASGYECVQVEDAHLPRPLAGGVSASLNGSLYCFGGSDGVTPSADVMRLSVSGNNVKVETIASLPEGFAPAAAAAHEGKIYVHGAVGQANALYAYNPSNNSWTALAACPSRVISEGACFVPKHNGREAAMFLIGGRGVDAEGLHIAGNVWEYLPTHNTWNKKAAFVSDGEPVNLMYSSAVPYGSGHILVFGGDDGVEFIKRMELEKAQATDELREAFLAHQGFSNEIFAYHPITDTWVTMATADAPLPAVTTAVNFGGDIIIPSGEARPGVRTDEILVFKVKDTVSFGWLNYTVIILYLFGMLGIGFYFSRKEKSTEQFFKGGSSIPWWAAGVSIFATALSAITFLSIPAKAYAADWNMFMFNMAIIMIVPIVIHFYIPFFRKLKVASAYQYLEERFSTAVRYLASAFFCIFMFARVAVVLFLPSLALNAVTGLDIYLCIFLMGVVTIIYCTMGGIEAVVWGDFIQGIILVGGALLCLFWIVGGVDGGFTTIMDVAVDNQKFKILDFSLDPTKPVLWIAILGGIANQLLTYTSDQSVIQRYITVKDTSDTKKGLWLNGILSIPIAFIFFGIGTGLYVFFKQNPDLLAVSMSNADSIFPHYIMCKLPAGVAGLLIAAIFAAAMSTLSSNINSASTVMTEDFYSKWSKKVTDAKKMTFAKVSGIVVGGLGIVMACALATFDIASLWDQFNFFLGLLTSGLGGLFMMGIFTKRIGPKAAFTGFAGSIVVLLLCNGYTHITVVLYGLIGLVSCFVIGWISSFIYGYNK